MTKKGIAAILLLAGLQSGYAQNKDSLTTFTNPEKHQIVDLPQVKFRKKPKNIILFIGDGMGVAQIFAGITANGGSLNLNHMKHIGFSQTQSTNNYITDSAAGGTALACGTRTNNGVIGMDPEGKPVKSILHISEENLKATGLVSTSAITHATPASFIAHQPSRNMYEAIAADFLKTDIDLFIGGGEDHFKERQDNRDLTEELKTKGYSVFSGLDAAQETSKAPMAIFTAGEHNPAYPERGEMLPEATKKAIDVLKQDKNGFFLMVEGSQIDWGGHDNSTPYIVHEMLDMDRALGIALSYACENRETLVIVTADHETGGMTINGGNFEKGSVTARYTSTGHSAVMVPVFAYGPGAEEFLGIYDNTDVFNKIKRLFGF